VLNDCKSLCWHRFFDEFDMTQTPYQFQYNTGRGIATFVVKKAGQDIENAYHVMIEEDESIAEFYGTAASSSPGRSLLISKAVTDLPMWLHSGDVLRLLMNEIDNVMQ
jgi:hypothetical protein